MRLQVPQAVLSRARSEGPAGDAWLAGLEAVTQALAGQWGLSLGGVMSGGTEGLVIEATLADGRAAVLKVDRPGREGVAGEARTLLAAQGRGYAAVYAYDEAEAALLLERLGPKLVDLDLGVDAQIGIICDTLREAWRPPPEDAGLPTGADKAASLSAMIEADWEALGRPCTERVVETALDYVRARGGAFDPERAVWAHGDAHAWNTLQVPGQAGRFKFVDPDGLVVEPAYDLAIPMREWSAELLAGDPVALGRRRCGRLADASGADAEAIWQWGFIERVSTGLHCLRIGLEEGPGMLAVAEAWAGAAWD